MFKTKKILINGLQIYPSSTYASTLTGLISNLEKTQEVANLMGDGGIVGNSKINSKKINIGIYVKTTDDILAYLRLNRIFSNKKILLQVEYDYIGFLETYIYIDSMATNEDGDISVIATVENPYIETNNTKSIELGVIKNGGVFIGKQNSNFPMVFDTKITGNKGAVFNNCICTCYSIIQVIGSCSNIDIFNETTGERMKIDITLGSRDTLIIDSRPSTRGIYLNGIPQPQLKNGNWIRVIEGENIFIFNRTATDNDTTKHCKVMFKERWI